MDKSLYTTREKAELRKVLNIIKGTPIKLKQNKFSGKLEVSGGGFDPIWTMLTSTTGGRTDIIVKARKSLLRKLKTAKSKKIR